ncbi:MAG: hypothetical protein ACKO6N_24155 [Myxococcota bacterium]
MSIYANPPAEGESHSASQTLTPEEVAAWMRALDASEERERYRALLALAHAPRPLSPELVQRLEKLLHDPSRLVREQVRQLGPFTVAARAARMETSVPGAERAQLSPASPLLALLSFGSAIPGLMASVLSLMAYYAQGRFPFPSPLEVLMVVNLGLVLPFLLMGGLLMSEGSTPKRLAKGLAYGALLGAVGLTLGLQPAFDQLWAIQFSEAQAMRYRAFLSPQQVGMALLPLYVGQLFQLYFCGQALRQADAKLREEQALLLSGSASSVSAPQTAATSAEPGAAPGDLG